MSDYEYLQYAFISHYCARIKHLNHQFNCHQVFQTKFRGSLQSLYDIVHVSAHTLNIELLQSPKYPLIGLWLHC
jgi:hypothetical protein